MFKQSIQEAWQNFRSPPAHPCSMGTEEPPGAEFLSEHDESSDGSPSGESLISRRVHHLQLAVNEIKAKVQQITEDLLFINDCLDNLEECSRGHVQQSIDLQNSVDLVNIVLQRVSRSAEQHTTGK